jgi:membrane-bound hydrogenase subunit beta
MEQLEKIRLNLEKTFPFLEGKFVMPRVRRIFVEVPQDNFIEVLNHLKNKMDFNSLCTITGLDSGERFEVIYHLANDKGEMVNVKIFTPRSAPKVKTVTAIYEGATFYERELVDLLGIEVTGLAPGRRYPLPDDWPVGQYPLRKDWKSPAAMSEIKGGENA